MSPDKQKYQECRSFQTCSCFHPGNPIREDYPTATYIRCPFDSPFHTRRSRALLCTLYQPMAEIDAETCKEILEIMRRMKKTMGSEAVSKEYISGFQDAISIMDSRIVDLLKL